MKTGNRRFLVLLSVLTALCCIAVVFINFMGMPPFESAVAAASAPASSGTFSSGVADTSAFSAVSTVPSSRAAVSVSDAAGAPVDINTADANTLASLPGIGDTLAQRIIDYRNAHGPFTSTAQLDQVKGIGEKKMAELQGLITT
ncbi:ComEA family DNA-binding protein [Ethanoligenens harbinense]|uniref:Competence protein ComEA helix-hairpin-helix repeat protein n=1 Tax=Ethanoligenens harbinense (strain DSM 18485 / JCM 12961 / CGMCC 1.5033 / YUAN-3) TaxID=663278 RepID=E6U5Y0_ETHHY|nr:helix-hairpin-helix domain-containing protein [Ethanoligenens harbinense]ADU27997.1 competence protein ComEA helix-hairpin-helix repeat protein [Ethanoligenens harbinense YUAN-3]AVQ97017.1 hypothetical protein CXQ68_12835 [Ethanoligenens harbinense YUAN-3]AYF39678.1 hypothetical protein CXP51_12735 [Ethanoligenens harbinense]AYF42509.1 hypothetical protein CN246_13305 [Ethanoligenens harbinense]QCN93259.1 helix-hairpin-helix domain-containing protein [Ethanoligenens harbinense]